MKHTKKLPAILLTLLMLVSAMSGMSFAAEIVDSGSAGGISWTLDSDGLLTVSGTGAIPAEQFAENKSIKKLVIEDGITSVGRNAFIGCGNLEEAVIGKDVLDIQSSAFHFCSSLKEVTASSNLQNIGSDVFTYCAFFNDESKWKDDMLYIGDCIVGFRGTEMNLREGTKGIAGGTFEGSEISEINIPDSVVSIGEYAFYYCNNVKTVHIGKGVRTIDSFAFRFKFNNFEKITVDEQNPVFKAENNCLINKETKTLIRSFNSSLIPDDGSVETIGDSSFAGTDITGITVPSAVKTIGYAAFESCKSLRSITLSEGLETIGMFAFHYDTFESIYIPNSVKTIDTCAFAGCTSLKFIDLPGSITTMGGAVFEGCPDDLTLCVVSGSCAHKYALEYGLKIGFAECGHLHTSILESVAPTCTKAGYTGVTVCDECGKYISAGEVIQALGHTDKNGDYVCDVCQAQLEKPEEHGSEPSGACAKCGRNHSNDFFGKLLCIIYQIIAFFS